MTRTSPIRTDAEWESIIDRYLASGLSQSAFCEQEGISRFTFGPRYHRSPKFAGRRRDRRGSSTTSSGSVALRTRATPTALKPIATTPLVTIRLGDDVAVECPAAIGVETIASIARELAR